MLPDLSGEVRQAWRGREDSAAQRTCFGQLCFAVDMLFCNEDDDDSGDDDHSDGDDHGEGDVHCDADDDDGDDDDGSDDDEGVIVCNIEGGPRQTIVYNVYGVFFVDELSFCEGWTVDAMLSVSHVMPQYVQAVSEESAEEPTRLEDITWHASPQVLVVSV